MDLGRIFSAVPRVGGRVDGCTYCYSESDLELLGGDPAKVPDRLVRSFANEVIDHWSEDQYGLIWRGLAPRILTLLAIEPDERMLRGLAFAQFSTWPAEEQAAVRQEVREIVARAFTAWDDPFRLEELLTAVVQIDHELTPWLAYLDTLGVDGDAAIAGLAERWAYDLVASYSWGLINDFTEPIRDWLYSDALHERLTRMKAEEVKMTIAVM